jgi:hypothetical protein
MGRRGPDESWAGLRRQVREGLEAEAFADDDARWALADSARRAHANSALPPSVATRGADADELQAEKVAAVAAAGVDEAGAVACAAEWLGQEEGRRGSGVEAPRGGGVEGGGEAIVDKRRALRAVMAAISLP